MKRLQIMLEEELDDTLARLASERGTSKAALIRQFVRAAIGDLPPLEQDPPGGESTIHEVIRLKKAEWNEGRGLEFPEERVEDANLLSSKE